MFGNSDIFACLMLRIFVSYHPADESTALDFERQLAMALQPFDTEFRDKSKVSEETYRTEAAAFLEKADLFVAVLSMNYEDKPDLRWEMQQAVETQKNRPELQIVSIQARASAIPAILRPYPTALPPAETIETQHIARDRQLRRAAEAAIQILRASPETNEMPVGHIELPISITDLRERLIAQTDRINHAPLLALLKRLIRDVMVKREVLDVEESFKQLREKTRLSQLSIPQLNELAEPLQLDLQHTINRLDTDQLNPNWRAVFIRDYYHFTSDSRDDSTVPPFFVPTDEVEIPETLNLPHGPREQASPEQIGLLSNEQKNDFRRNLLLARDALAVKNPAQAYAYCDHVRRQIDPQSAQLYEYLLITFIQKETPARALREATEGNDRVLQHILLFASRLREYQRDQKCPSSTAMHNLAIASESISDAALRVYYHFPNDPLRHTGKHEEEVPDNRRALRMILDNTLKVCRLVYPSEELLEAAVIECCGGGKCAWLRRVEVVDGHFQFLPDGNFDLLGEIQELIRMLEQIEAEDPNKIVKGRALLREDLYFSLLAKRQALHSQLQEDARRRRPFTDVRESVVRFTYACLMGAHIFGDDDLRNRGNSFYRLALEYLLPGMLIAAPETDLAGLRWFTFDEDGALVAHPDCAQYGFDALGIVQKLVKDLAGSAGWMQVQPNIREAAYLQYRADNEVLLTQVKDGLSHTDFRKMDSLTARGILIDYLRRQVIAAKASPERGRPLLESCVEELSGNGILLWLQHNLHTNALGAHPDSLALGYDASAALKQIFEMLHEENPLYEDLLREQIARNIFEKRIAPAYNAVKKGDASKRMDLAWLMREAMSNYRLHPNTAYLDLIWLEITLELKLPWIDISYDGKAALIPGSSGFDAIQALNEIHQARPEQYKLLDARERIADRRHAGQVERYLREISEFRYENRQPERQIAIDIIRKIKGIYLYYPKTDYLELPWNELYAKPGQYRIRWNSRLLGLVPLQTDHFENQFFQFNYKFERYELKRLLDNQYLEMQRVIAEEGI